MGTTRETIVTTLNDAQSLRDLGLPEDAIVQADTLDSPTVRPFVVVRWLDEQPGVGAVTPRPFDLWVYDDPGDYTRCERIGVESLKILSDLDPIKTETGWISQIRTHGRGLGRGQDLYDDGYEAVVIPFRAIAIASGL